VRSSLPPAARAEFDAGLRAYDAKRYEEAIAAFRAAYEAAPRRQLLFAWAQAERLSGDCPSAITLYRKFLHEQPPSSEAEKASLHLARCEQALATRPAPPDEPTAAATAQDAPSHASPAPPRPASPPPAPAQRIDSATADRRSQSSPFYADVLADVLVGAGVAALGVGTAMLVAATAADSDAQDASSYRAFGDAKDTASQRRWIGAAGLVVGASLVTVGIVRWVGHDSRASVAVHLGPAGASAAALGAF
jgi:tetratricopeptide (TPR) repeat protein